MNERPIPDRKLVVGLIGGIGAGKSMVAEHFAQLGARVIDADRTGHEVLERSDVARRLVDAFGQSILDPVGRIDRSRLAALVFSDVERRRRLESIVHPVMAERFQEELQKGINDPNVPLIVLDAAILMETGWHAICDHVVFVETPREIRLSRLMETRGWPAEELDRREAAQWPNEKKKAHADVVIDNGGDRRQTLEQVDQIFRDWAPVHGPAEKAHERPAGAENGVIATDS